MSLAEHQGGVFVQARSSTSHKIIRITTWKARRQTDTEGQRQIQESEPEQCAQPQESLVKAGKEDSNDNERGDARRHEHARQCALCYAPRRQRRESEEALL